MLHRLSLLLSFALLATASTAQVVINEFVARNDSTGGYQEPDGGYGDWIELYNLGAASVDLSDYQLSDRLDSLDRWTFPAGTSIAADGYLIVWADDDLDQTGVHANFKLSGGGEEIALSRNGTILDQVIFGEQEVNRAEARLPNGTGEFQRATPTPLDNNETLGLRGAPAPKALRAYPTLASDVLTVDLAEGTYRNFRVVDAAGATVQRGNVAAGATLRVDVSALPSGWYVVTFDQGRARASFARR